MDGKDATPGSRIFAAISANARFGCSRMASCSFFGQQKVQAHPPRRTNDNRVFAALPDSLG
jgi:hypothetical protein